MPERFGLSRRTTIGLDREQLVAFTELGSCCRQIFILSTSKSQRRLSVSLSRGSRSTAVMIM